MRCCRRPKGTRRGGGGRAGPLLLRGGGTRTLGHAVGEVLETGGLSGVELYEPGALTLVAGRARRWPRWAVLAAERQRLAFEVPDLRGLLGREGVSTIGGVVAANASGPRRVQAGPAAMPVWGCASSMAPGTVVKNGGRVMKNVTGYDLVKLLAGSRGTLGVLTEVSFKVQALPEAEATLIVEGFGDEAGLAALRAALGSPFDVSGAARHTGRSLIRVEGMAGSVAYRVARLRERIGGEVTLAEGAASAALWREVRDVAPLQGNRARSGASPPCPPRRRDRRAAGGEAVWDWGGGLVWLLVEPGRGAEVAATVAGRGHATLVRGQGGPVFPPEAPEVTHWSRG
jgi:glycolate oxidase FAD binding subunit